MHDLCISMFQYTTVLDYLSTIIIFQPLEAKPLEAEQSPGIENITSEILIDGGEAAR